MQDFVARNAVKRWISERVTAPRRAMIRAYGVCRRLEQGTEGEIEAWQETHLRTLLARASAAPYWNEVLRRAGVDARRARLSDLERLPFLTKDILRAQGDRLRMPGAEGVYENYSGGSTGVPVRFWQDANFAVWLSAATKRSNEMAGGFVGARVAKLWGAPQDKRKIEGLAGRAKLWLLNQRYYDTFDMGAERMGAYHESMESFQPDIIQAYASSAFLMARYLSERGLEPSYPRLSVVSAAEKLYPHMREKIESVFGVDVYDRYGSRELPAVAAECCHHDGLHVQMGAYIVETVDPATGAAVEGVPGEIAVTSLHDYAMPFLRYRIGDVGTLRRERCRCGSSFVRLGEICGRTSDNFLMDDGRIVHGEYFTHLFYGRDGVEQFQFEQESPAEYVLRLVPSPDYSPRTGAALEQELREVIGQRARLRIELRNAIPLTASGKYRFTISQVSVDELAGRRA
ncbi:MAG: hypothetical protein U0Q16_37255 [Bryobacteraceae bacterium]